MFGKVNISMFGKIFLIRRNFGLGGPIWLSKVTFGISSAIGEQMFTLVNIILELKSALRTKYLFCRTLLYKMMLPSLSRLYMLPTMQCQAFLAVPLAQSVDCCLLARRVVWQSRFGKVNAMWAEPSLKDSYTYCRSSARIDYCAKECTHGQLHEENTLSTDQEH